MNDGRWTLWPDRAFMPADRIIGWANDLVADGDAYDGTLEGAIALLQDAGVVTFAKLGIVPTEDGEVDIQED